MRTIAVACQKSRNLSDHCMGGNLGRRFGFDGDLNVRVERSLALMQKNVVVAVQ